MIAIQERVEVINMDDKNLKGLYDTLKKDGYNPPEYDTFKNDMQDNKNLQGVYNTLKKEGYTPPEYDVFRQDMFGGTQSPSMLNNGSVSQQVIDEYDKVNLSQSELSPYVRGKGANVEIFGVPLSDYNNMSSEDQSRTYSEAIARKKQEEKNVFSNYISSQLGEIDGKLNQRREAVVPAAGSAFIPSSAVAAAQRFGNNDNKEVQDRYTALHAAKNLLDDASKVAEEAKKGDTGFFSGLGRGFKDKFMDADNWTMGLTDTAYSGLLKNAVEKEERGEELSPEELKLLDAAAVNMATQAYFSSEMGRGYKAGNMSAENIPFMLEFAVNPISSTGNVLAKGLLKYGLKRFGRAAASNVSKIAGRLMGDAVAAAGMTTTSSIGRVISGANERMIGDVQATVEDGEIKYDGRENRMDAGEAYFKSGVSNFLENQSEMIFNAFGGGGKMAKEALGKFVPGFSKLSNSEIARFIGRVSNNPAIKNVAKRTQFHGILGEYAEEVYNNFANIPLGEMTIEQATDLDQNIDTFLGLAPTSVVFGALGLGGMARDSYTSKRNLRRFKDGLSQDDKEMFDELQQYVNEGNNEIVKSFIKRTLADDKLTSEQKKERVFSVQDMEKEKVAEDVQAETTSTINAPEEIEANKVDIYRNYKRAERKVNSLVPAEIIPQLDAVTDIEQFAHDNNLNDNQAMVVADYLSAKQPYNQYEEQTSQRREEAKVLAREQAAVDVEKISNPETGLVSQVKHKSSEAPVYLVGGRLSFGEDGLLDRDNSSETVYYVDDKGERKMANYEDFDGVLNEIAIPDMIAQAEMDAENDFMLQEEQSLSSPNIPDPRKGDIATVNIEGATYAVEVNPDNPSEEFLLSKLNAEGELDIEHKNGNVSYPIGIDEYYNLKEAELWKDTSIGLQDGMEQPIGGQVSEISVTDGIATENDRNTIISSESEDVNANSSPNKENKMSDEPVKETPEMKKIRIIDSLPKKKDGKMDYDAFTPRQQYEYTSVTEGEQTATSDLKEEISAREKQLEKMNERLTKVTGGEKAEVRDAVREHKSALDELNTFYRQVVPSSELEEETPVEINQPIPNDLRTDEDYISWIADNSEDSSEILDAYSVAKELASHEQTLKPWQKELLGRKIRPDSFNRFGDRNHVTGGLAKAWLRKDGEEIDTLAQELNTFGGEVSEQDIIDFMLDNPSNHVSQVSESMRSLSSKFSEIATKEMGIPVSGPESNTGKLYIRLKEANQKLNELSEQQKTDIQGALTADMDVADEQRASLHIDSLDDYVSQYDQFRNEMNEETADEAIIQDMETSDPELYHGGFTAEELDDIYSQIENNSGTERQTENSGENQPSLSGEEIERSQEPGISVVAGAENNENEREDRIAEVGETGSIGVPVGYDNSENNQEIEDVAPFQEGMPVDTVPAQDTIVPQEEQPSFISPVINPGENVLDYVGRIASEKEEYDGRSVVDIDSTSVQVEEVVPESVMGAQEESMHIEEGNRVIGDAQQTLNKIVEEREKVNQAPTEAQKEVGNYRKGHVKVDGYNIYIENPKGSERNGVDANSQPWSVTMNNDYGYVRGTKGVDGDHIDMFLSDFPDQGNVFVVDQVKDDGSFDEHKVMYGFSSADEAKEAYLANYSPGWKGLGNITEVSKDEFKKWIDSSVRKTKPFAEYKNVKAENVQKENILLLPDNSGELKMSLLENESAAEDTLQDDNLRFREKDSYTEEEQSIAEKANKNGSFMKAPNGKKTNLTDKQWVQVRTKAFKNWFGDWENSPKNTAKVVDKNGEPLVFYHGTLSKNIERFRKDMIGSRYSYDESGFFFIDKENIAKDYSTSEFDATVKGGVIPVFLNIRKPIVVDNKWAVKNGLGNALKNMDSIEFWDNYQSFMLDEIENNKSDGVIINDGSSKMVVVFEPNQIKSATENTGEFSSFNDAIRLRDNSDSLNISDAGKAVSVINSLSEILRTPVRMIRTVEELPDGKAKHAIEKGKNVKAWYDINTGEVSMYLPNVNSAADAAKSVLHEVVGHKGLRDLFGTEKYDDMMAKLYKQLPSDIQKYVSDVADGKYGGNTAIVMDEYLAEQAEKDETPSWWRRVVSSVRDFLREMGVDVTLTANDVKYLLWKSKNRLMKSDNGMDLINKVAADENMKERFHISEYARTPEQEKADYDRASKAVSDFAQDHAGAANALVIHSRDMTRKQLEAIGMPNESIEEIENAFNSGEAVAVYNEEVGKVIISNNGASDKELKGYLWHENAHKAIREIFGDKAEEAINPVYEWLNKRRPDDCLFIRNLYSENAESVQKEECAVAYFEKMFSIHGEDNLKEIINDASSLEIKDFFGIIFNYIVYGTEEEGNRENRSLGRGFQTELEMRNSGNARTGEEKEGTESKGTRDESGTGEEVIRFRDETEEPQSDGTREAYEKAINTKGKGGKAHLSAYNFQEAFQDEMLSVKILQEIIEDLSGEKLKGFENAHLAENRLDSTNRQQRNKFIEDFYEPMMKIVDSLVKKGVSEKEIKNYLIAKSGLERNREFAVRDAIAAKENDSDKQSVQKLRKQYEDNRDILRKQYAERKLDWDEYQDKLDELAALYAGKFVDYSGLTAITGDETHFTDIAKDIVREFEAKQNTDALWSSINAATKFALKKSYDSGITSKEAYNHVSNMFEYYIPMRGWSEETAEDVYDYINQDRGTFSATIKKAEGHLHESQDPFAIIGNMAESAILQGNRNLMKQKFMNMVINHPSDVAKLGRVWFKESGDK